MDVVPNQYEFIDKNSLKEGEKSQPPQEPCIVNQMLFTFAFYVFMYNNKTLGLDSEWNRVFFHYFGWRKPRIFFIIFLKN